MNSRYNFKWTPPEKHSNPVKVEFKLIKKIMPLSFNEDKTVKEYTEEEKYIETRSKWRSYIASFDLGSPSEQIISHLKKGTPLVTGHTLPHGDYTNLSQGAEVVRLMRQKGITLEMVESALNSFKHEETVTVPNEKEAE